MMGLFGMIACARTPPIGRTIGSAIAATGLPAAPRLVEALTGAALTVATGSAAVGATAGFAGAALTAAGAAAGTLLLAATGAAMAFATGFAAGAAFAATLGTTFDGAITFPLTTGVGFATTCLLLACLFIACAADAGLISDLTAALTAGAGLGFVDGLADATDFALAAGFAVTAGLALAFATTGTAFAVFVGTDLATTALPALALTTGFTLAGVAFTAPALRLAGLAAAPLTDEVLLPAEPLLAIMALAAGFTNLANAAANFPTAPDFAAGFATGLTLVGLATGFGLDFGFAATILPDFLRLSGRVL